MSAAVVCGADIIAVAADGVWGGFWAPAKVGEISSSAMRVTMDKREILVIGDAGSVSEKGVAQKCASVSPMDKKEINSTKLTANFLVWIGGVFMLLLFALLAHFVWRLF